MPKIKVKGNSKASNSKTNTKTKNSKNSKSDKKSKNGKHIKNGKESFMFYPELNEKDFFKNIYVKKEFFKNRIPKTTDKTPEEMCNPNEFILMSHQEFLRNFISQDTPYNGILIYHGTGFGKTCSAISIAEGFKDILMDMNKKALIILGAKIRQNFKKTIYNLEKEYNKKKPDDIVQCTGNTYTITQPSLTYKQKQRKINSEINSYYEFFGPEQLSNYVMKRLTNWDGNPDHLTPQNINAIKKEYSNRIIIIDEVHNIKTLESEKDIFKKKSPTVIETIIKYADNCRLVLMSATPMFDNPKEIIYIMNLLLLTDNRPIVKEEKIFDKRNNLTVQGAITLKDSLQGYVSYLMGKNPLIFPIKVLPKVANTPKVKYDLDNNPIPENQQLKLSKLVTIPMGELQNKTYHNINTSLKKKKVFGTRETLGYVANFVFPNAQGDGVIAREAFRNFDDGRGSFVRVYKNYKDIKTGKTKKAMYFRYQKHTLANRGTPKEKPFFDKSLIKNYSGKMDKILKTISESEGIIYIYSRWIDPGVVPIALALEQNGFQRYTFPGETPLLDYSPNSVGGGGKSRGICYMCGGDIKDPIHNKKSKNFKHEFGLAKYILLTGSSEISNIDPSDAAEIINKSSNKYGKDVKVVIGTRVTGEGIDFARIRQVWIMEPWYNYSRIEQVEGRAVRNCSHIDLPKSQRNVEIYLLASVFPSKTQSDKETIDLKNYRISENKYIKIKVVEDVIKKNAVDCALNKNGNYNVVDEKFLINTSSGETFKYDMKNELNTNPHIYRMEPTVDYECDWQPTNEFLKHMNINTDTYNIRFAQSDIQSVIKYIKLLYRYNIIFDMDTIMNFVKRYMPTIEKNFVYKALDTILKSDKEIIYDKYNRKGKLIYRGNYYVFQPLELDYDRLPVYYRAEPLTFKTKSILVDEMLAEIPSNNSTNNSNKINKTAFDKVQNTYQEYLKLLNNMIVENEIKFNDNVYYLLISMILDRANNQDTLSIAFNTMDLYFKDLKTFKSNKVAGYILEYMKDNDMVIYKSRDLIDPKVAKYKKGDIIGFTFNDKYYCHQTSSNSTNNSKNSNTNAKKNGAKKSHGKLDLCGSVLQQKIVYLRDLKLDKKTEPQWADVVGLLQNDGLNSPIFKIIDLTKGKKKTALPGGRVCSTFNMENLFEIRKIIEMKNPGFPSKAKRDNVCLEIEFMLRYFNQIKQDKKDWFVTKRVN